MSIDIEKLVKNLEETKDCYMLNHLNNIAPGYHLDALKAIKQLQSEIERLEKNNKIQHETWSELVVKNQSEISELKFINETFGKEILLLERKVENQTKELNSLNSIIGKVKKAVRLSLPKPPEQGES